jgi:hypothetical protein
MKASPSNAPPHPNDDTALDSVTTCAALLLLADKFPRRQFNTTELSTLSSLGRTVLSQIKNVPDTPFSLGKCSFRRLDTWLASHPGFKSR